MSQGRKMCIDPDPHNVFQGLKKVWSYVSGVVVLYMSSESLTFGSQK